MRAARNEQKAYRASVKRDRHEHFHAAAMRAQLHAENGSLKGVFQAQRDLAPRLPRPPASLRDADGATVREQIVIPPALLADTRTATMMTAMLFWYSWGPGQT